MEMLHRVPRSSGEDPRAEEDLRERVLVQGAGSLSDAELLSVLLSGNGPEGPAFEHARELLSDVRGLSGLIGIDSEALRNAGAGAEASARIVAAVEFACRLARARMPERESLRSPGAVARYLALRYGRPDQEVMGALYLDTRHAVVNEAEIFRGTLARMAAEPGAILRRGIVVAAAGFILFHTHPSGDPSPSAEDLAFTRRLAEAADLTGLRLVDHLVLGGPSRWVSLRERGGW